MRSASRLADIAPFHVMELLTRAKVLEAEGRDIIHMEVGEPDFPTPAPIIAAAQQAIADGRVTTTGPRTARTARSDLPVLPAALRHRRPRITHRRHRRRLRRPHACACLPGRTGQRMAADRPRLPFATAISSAATRDRRRHARRRKQQFPANTSTHGKALERAHARCAVRIAGQSDRHHAVGFGARGTGRLHPGARQPVDR